MLSMEEVDKPEPMRARGGAWFRSGTVEIHLEWRPTSAPTARRTRPCRRSVRNSGCEVLWDERYPGVRRFYAHDPFGNRIEFLQPASGIEG